MKIYDSGWCLCVGGCSGGELGDFGWGCGGVGGVSAPTPPLHGSYTPKPLRPYTHTPPLPTPDKPQTRPGCRVQRAGCTALRNGRMLLKQSWAPLS